MGSSRIHESQSIALPSICALAVGTVVVVLTSPTIAALSSSTTTVSSLSSFDGLLMIQALITDLTFIFLISFSLLCNHDASAKWIARNQSFPYSYSPAWNLGPRSLDFQLLIFEIFHVGWFARTIHMLGIVFEEGLWAMIVCLTFGKWGLALLLTGLAIQGIGYCDPHVGIGILFGNVVVVGGCSLFVEVLLVEHWTMEPVQVLNVLKVLLFWIVTIRTLSHVLEPLPPTYRPEVECFDNNFGVVGWKLCLSDLPKALWLVILGNVSEFGAGMPGRLFNVVVYKCLYKTGFRSNSGLLDVQEAKLQARQVIEHGWLAHPETARMYEWALAGGISLPYEEVIDEKDERV